MNRRPHRVDVLAEMRRVAPTLNYAEQFEQVDNVELRVIEFTVQGAASAEQILFIPGWASTPYTWRHFVPNLCQYGNVLYLETREKPSSRLQRASSFDVAAVGSDVVKFVENRLGGRRYGIIGASAGANVVIEAWRTLTPKPCWSVLLLPHREISIPKYVLLLKFLPAAILPLVKSILLALISRGVIPKSLSAQRDGILSALDRADMRKLRSSAAAWRKYCLDPEHAAYVDVPALVVGATRDPVHAVGEAREILVKLPKGCWYDAETFTSAHGSRTANFILEWIGTAVGTGVQAPARRETQ